jgi:hypothetical protein
MSNDESSSEEEKQEPPPHLRMIQRLLTRVVHDHTRSQVTSSGAMSRVRESKDGWFVHDMSRRKRGVLKLRKRLVEEARYLIL